MTGCQTRELVRKSLVTCALRLSLLQNKYCHVFSDSDIFWFVSPFMITGIPWEDGLMMPGNPLAQAIEGLQRGGPSSIRSVFIEDMPVESQVVGH